MSSNIIRLDGGAREEDEALRVADETYDEVVSAAHAAADAERTRGESVRRASISRADALQAATLERVEALRNLSARHDTMLAEAELERAAALKSADERYSAMLEEAARVAATRTSEAYDGEVAAARAAHEAALRAAEVAAEATVARAEAIRQAGLERAEAIRAAGVDRAAALRHAVATYESRLADAERARGEELRRIVNRHDAATNAASAAYEQALQGGAGRSAGDLDDEDLGGEDLEGTLEDELDHSPVAGNA